MSATSNPGRVAGVWYLLLVFWRRSTYQDAIFLYAQPAFFGEIALVLWLLIKGAAPEMRARTSFV